MIHNTSKFTLATLVRPSIAALQPYSSARDEFKDVQNKMIFIDANENPYENGVNRYPDPHQNAVKQTLASLKGINSNNILLGNGSDEVLDLIFRAFCEPATDNVISLPPTYGMYKVLAAINNVENREVLLSKEFEPRVPHIFEAVDARTKIIFLCSPNNPTGNSFSTEHVLEILQKFNGLVVIDEAYIDFSEQESWLQRLEEFPNLIITQTFSKAYGMAGIRIGICYASEAVITILKKIKPPYNVNVLSQKKAVERLSEINSIKNEITTLIEDRDSLLKQLLQVNFIEKIYPTDANFILVKVDDAGKRYQQLLDKEIVCRNRSSQPLCENTLRFTVGTSAENAHLIQTLKSL